MMVPWSHHRRNPCSLRRRCHHHTTYYVDDNNTGARWSASQSSRQPSGTRPNLAADEAGSSCRQGRARIILARGDERPPSSSHPAPLRRRPRYCGWRGCRDEHRRHRPLVERPPLPSPPAAHGAHGRRRRATRATARESTAAVQAAQAPARCCCSVPCCCWHSAPPRSAPSRASPARARSSAGCPRAAAASPLRAASPCAPPQSSAAQTRAVPSGPRAPPVVGGAVKGTRDAV